jgi:hypothetical protein
MRDITKAQLAEILEKHRLWIFGAEGGERADLRYADLRYADLSSADLRSADLRYATGNMGEIKTLLLDTWQVVYTSEYLHIGCERHTITDWWGFDDARIARMEGRALGWWKKYSPLIKQTIELSPATPASAEPAQSEEAAA